MIYTVLRSTAGVAHNKRGGYLIMVAGHLREKKGYFYAVLNYTDAHGNRKTKWIATGLGDVYKRQSYRSSGAVSRKMCRLQETFFLQTSWNNGLR